MLKAMTDDADEFSEQLAGEAFERARASGRGDVADYLLLKTSNDKIRAAALEWLFDSALAFASEANRQKGFSIAVEREDAYRFAFGNSNLRGSRLVLRQTVRCLTVEAGWTRAPSDGFMRGGALAGGRITHFGIANANEELLLVREANNLVNWFAVDKENKRSLFDAKTLRQHFEIFFGE